MNDKDLTWSHVFLFQGGSLLFDVPKMLYLVGLFEAELGAVVLELLHFQPVNSAVRGKGMGVVLSIVIGIVLTIEVSLRLVFTVMLLDELPHLNPAYLSLLYRGQFFLEKLGPLLLG